VIAAASGFWHTDDEGGLRTGHVGAPSGAPASWPPPFLDPAGCCRRISRARGPAIRLGSGS
jgi:hypothetical protein